MTSDGDHGGDSPSELEAGMFAYSPTLGLHTRCFFIKLTELTPFQPYSTYCCSNWPGALFVPPAWSAHPFLQPGKHHWRSVLAFFPPFILTQARPPSHLLPGEPGKLQALLYQIKRPSSVPLPDCLHSCWWVFPWSSQLEGEKPSKLGHEPTRSSVHQAGGWPVQLLQDIFGGGKGYVSVSLGRLQPDCNGPRFEHLIPAHQRPAHPRSQADQQDAFPLSLQLPPSHPRPRSCSGRIPWPDPGHGNWT